MKLSPSVLFLFINLLCTTLSANDRQDTTFKIFQFPANSIPRIDGDTHDWNIVPDAYRIRTDQLIDDEGKHSTPDSTNLDVSVRIGWVKGLNRLYVLYEAYDDYWDFSLPTLHNDTFELVVDGDASGGPLIDKGHKKLWKPEHVGAASIMADDRISVEDANWAIHGVHAQNYHIFTPAKEKDWTMVWGVQSWIKELPFANAAYHFDVQPGETGKVVLEFWITPFDYAGPEGPERAVPSVLEEEKIIGLSFAIIDYDDVNNPENNGFWNLSREHLMYGHASYLCAFKLMPLEPQFRNAIEADWSFKILNMSERRVAFLDQSVGEISKWHWDFGDGTTSNEQHPIHNYQKSGHYVVILDIEGPEGKSRLSKVWDVTVK